MAAGVLSAPGSEYGPCESECWHRDCSLTRDMAAAVCSHCGESIGYDTRFYNVSDMKQPDTYVHASCEEKRIDEQSSAVDEEHGNDSIDPTRWNL